VFRGFGRLIKGTGTNRASPRSLAGDLEQHEPGRLITCGQQLRSRAASFRPRHGCSLPHQIRHPCPKPSRVARRWDTGDVGRDCAADRNRPPPSIAIGFGPTASTPSRDRSVLPRRPDRCLAPSAGAVIADPRRRRGPRPAGQPQQPDHASEGLHRLAYHSSFPNAAALMTRTRISRDLREPVDNSRPASRHASLRTWSAARRSVHSRQSDGVVRLGALLRGSSATWISHVVKSG
jgi:hypothetical protein